jgi:hypothetical protein
MVYDHELCHCIDDVTHHRTSYHNTEGICHQTLSLTDDATHTIHRNTEGISEERDIYGGEAYDVMVSEVLILKLDTPDIVDSFRLPYTSGPVVSSKRVISSSPHPVLFMASSCPSPPFLSSSYLLPVLFLSFHSPLFPSPFTPTAVHFNSKRATTATPRTTTIT